MITDYVKHDMEFDRVEPLSIFGETMKPEELVGILSFSFSQDDVISIISLLNKSSLKFLIHNLEKIIGLLGDMDETYKIQEVNEIHEHEAGVNQVVFISPTEIASASHDFTIKVWDVNSLDHLKTISTETCNSMCITGF